MYDTGKTAQVTNEMRRNRLHILRISKCRWTCTGYYKTQTGETTLYSGNNDDQHHGGVVLILRKGLRNYLMEWKPVSERLLYARFKRKQVNMSILQCYTPRNNAEDEEKELLFKSSSRG